MKIPGLLLLIAGWGIVVAALALLERDWQRNAFLLAGIAVEILGLILLAKAHLPPRKSRRTGTQAIAS